jgi:hypothetical protein
MFSRTEILDVDIFISASTYKRILQLHYRRISLWSNYKSTILRLLTKCLIHHACVVNSYHARILTFLVDVAIIVCLLHL